MAFCCWFLALVSTKQMQWRDPGTMDPKPGVFGLEVRLVKFKMTANPEPKRTSHNTHPCNTALLLPLDSQPQWSPILVFWGILRSQSQLRPEIPGPHSASAMELDPGQGWHGTGNDWYRGTVENRNRQKRRLTALPFISRGGYWWHSASCWRDPVGNLLPWFSRLNLMWAGPMLQLWHGMDMYNRVWLSGTQVFYPYKLCDQNKTFLFLFA